MPPSSFAYHLKFESHYLRSDSFHFLTCSRFSLIINLLLLFFLTRINSNVVDAGSFLFPLHLLLLTFNRSVIHCLSIRRLKRRYSCQRQYHSVQSQKTNRPLCDHHRSGSSFAQQLKTRPSLIKSYLGCYAISYKTTWIKKIGKIHKTPISGTILILINMYQICKKCYL